MSQPWLGVRVRSSTCPWLVLSLSPSPQQQPGLQQCPEEAGHLTGRQHGAQVPLLSPPLPRWVEAVGQPLGTKWPLAGCVTCLPCCPGRVLLSVMYLMVENIRVEQEVDPPEWKTCRETFRMELSEPQSSLCPNKVPSLCWTVGETSGMGDLL